MLTIEEASKYSGIGINKLRQLISADRNANFIVKNGNKSLIKRKMFESYIDRLSAV